MSTTASLPSGSSAAAAYEDFLAAYSKEVRVCFAASLTFVITAWLSFLLRCFVRIKFLRSFDYNDWAMLPAVLFCSSSAILAIIPSYVFLHGHWTNDETLQKVTTAATALYIWGMAFLKVSLGLFFIKLYTAERWKRYLVYLMMILTAVAGAAYFFVATCTCGVSAILGQYTGEYCSTFDATKFFSLFWSALNATTDITFSILAGLTIYPLNLPKATKLGAFALLLFGTIGGMASLFRLVYLVSLIHPGSASLSLIQTVRVVYWTQIETGIGVTAANLATLRPLFACFFERIQTRASSSATGRRDDGTKNWWKPLRTPSPSHSKGTVNTNALTPDDLDDFIIDPEKEANESTLVDQSSGHKSLELVQHDSHVASMQQHPPNQTSNVTVVKVRVPNNNQWTPVQSKHGPPFQKKEQSGYTPDDLQLM